MRPAKNKATLLDVSHRVYEGCLLFYPKDLRSDFGSEMIEVFDEQILEAYSLAGFTGLLHVWYRAMREIVAVAFPARLVERVGSIVITVTLIFMLWFASYISYVMQTACSSCRVN